MQEEVAVWEESLRAECFDRTFAGDERRRVTSCTTDSLEESLPFQGLVSNGSPWRRSQQLHKVFEVVDAPQPRVRIQRILQSRNRIEKSNLRAVTARTNLV